MKSQAYLSGWRSVLILNYKKAKVSYSNVDISETKCLEELTAMKICQTVEEEDHVRIFYTHFDIYKNICEDTQEMPQSWNIAFPKHQKERWGTNNHK